MSSTTFTIDIWSDVMCPWCLVGWGNLSQAIGRLHGEIAVDIRWRAFELNPDMASEGEERTAHLARKYGGTPDQARAVQGRMREAADGAGVSLDYQGGAPEPAAMMWNTFAAHKLLHWAGEAYGGDAQTRLKIALFEAHFNQRRNVGDEAVLLEVADSVGLPRDAAAAALSDDATGAAVRAEERMAWERNITGVPAVVIAEKFLIPGAQSPEVYATALRRVAEKLAVQAAPNSPRPS